MHSGAHVIPGMMSLWLRLKQAGISKPYNYNNGYRLLLASRGTELKICPQGFRPGILRQSHSAVPILLRYRRWSPWVEYFFARQKSFPPAPATNLQWHDRLPRDLCVGLGCFEIQIRRIAAYAGMTNLKGLKPFAGWRLLGMGSPPA